MLGDPEERPGAVFPWLGVRSSLYLLLPFGSAYQRICLSAPAWSFACCLLLRLMDTQRTCDTYTLRTVASLSILHSPHTNMTPTPIAARLPSSTQPDLQSNSLRLVHNPALLSVSRTSLPFLTKLPSPQAGGSVALLMKQCSSRPHTISALHPGQSCYLIIVPGSSFIIPCSEFALSCLPLLYGCRPPCPAARARL